MGGLVIVQASEKVQIEDEETRDNFIVILVISIALVHSMSSEQEIKDRCP